MGLMKNLGIAAKAGNPEAIAAVRENERLLALRDARNNWQGPCRHAIPCTAELAEHGIVLSAEEYEELLRGQPDEPWPPEDEDAFARAHDQVTGLEDTPF